MKKFRKLGSKIMTSLLSLAFMLSLVQLPVRAATSEEIWVNGKNIIIAPNHTVQCGSGTAVYSPDTNTLTLNNAEITTPNGAFRGIDIGADMPLTISLVGYNSVSGISSGIESETDLTISGSGTLAVSNLTAWAIYTKGALTIDGANITVNISNDGGIFSEGKISIINSATVITNGRYYGFQGENGMNISDSIITASATENGCNAIYIKEGDLTVEKGSSLTATSKNPALWAKNSIILADSTVDVTSTGDWAIWSPNTLAIIGDSEVTAKGATGSLGAFNVFTISPATDKSVEVYSGTEAATATALDDSPFAEETDLKALDIGKNLYFHSKTHTHTAGAEWLKDAANHWHKCTAADGTEMEKAPHAFGAWVTDTEATETAKGSKHRDCTVCGQREAAEIPVITPTPEKPVVTVGAGSVHQINSGKDMTWTCSGKLEDLIGIYVDGKLLDKSNYTTASGSTVLTLKASYLDTLSAGTHTLKFQYKDNLSADATFTITAKSAQEKPEKPKDKVVSPKTGDTSNLALLMSLLVLSGGAVVFGLKKK